MIRRRSILATAALLGTAGGARGQALAAIRVGQATPAMSFLPLTAARALGSFAAAGLDLYWAALPGGDLACLAALDRGEIELAAAGAETVLSAFAKGQPVQMVASLMSKMSLELVVSDKLIERSGVAPADDPLDKRLAVLDGATIGVGALGGTQDRAARWLARQAGLDPRTGIRVVLAGPPAAAQAALEAGRIDAFVLSPPEGLLAEDARIGQVLVRMGDEFPALQGIPSLVLVAKTPVGAERRSMLVQACAALARASAEVLADPAAAAAQIGAKLFPPMKAPVVAAAVASLKTGIAGRGRFDPAGIGALLAYAGDAAAGLDPRSPFWTNEYWDEAARVTLPPPLTDATIPELPGHYRGKVRDNYDLPDGRRILVATDRLSAFDTVLASIPAKGQVLTATARYWFERTADLCPNWVDAYPDPNAAIGRRLRILPVEIVVRGYLAGTTGTSILTQYKAGARRMYGHSFPDGMRDNQALPAPLITPTSKAVDGAHDAPLTHAEIIATGLLTTAQWDEVAALAQSLYARGAALAAGRGLILADTKYEFGTDAAGGIVLADEIHTPDSSRYWRAGSYGARFEAGEKPDSFDKDFVRNWVAARCDPYRDPIPAIPPDLVDATARVYIEAFETITGETFVPAPPGQSVLPRIRANLRRYFA